jgi:glycosyltransferase involved in cell wall biosynthesis
MGKRTEWPLVSVCITSFNRLHYLQRTLESFRECCTYPNLEYIIVDNDSETEVVEYVKSLDYMDHKIMNEQNMGHGYAMNQARKLARGDYYFNLENDWLFFYRADWLQRAVLLFEKDRKGEAIDKHPFHLPLGLVKFRLGAEIQHYTNNPSLVLKEAYQKVGEYTQFGREYKFVSESFGKIEKEYISRFGAHFANALTETPCVMHIGHYTTNPNYGNRGRKSHKELDDLLADSWKNGKRWFTWSYYQFIRKMQLKKVIRRNDRFQKQWEMELQGE